MLSVESWTVCNLCYGSGSLKHTDLLQGCLVMCGSCSGAGIFKWVTPWKGDYFRPLSEYGLCEICGWTADGRKCLAPEGSDYHERIEALTARIRSGRVIWVEVFSSKPTDISWDEALDMVESDIQDSGLRMTDWMLEEAIKISRLVQQGMPWWMAGVKTRAVLGYQEQYGLVNGYNRTYEKNIIRALFSNAVPGLPPLGTTPHPIQPTGNHLVARLPVLPHRWLLSAWERGLETKYPRKDYEALWGEYLANMRYQLRMRAPTERVEVFDGLARNFVTPKEYATRVTPMIAEEYERYLSEMAAGRIAWVEQLEHDDV